MSNALLIFILLTVAAPAAIAQVPQCPHELSPASVQVRPASGWLGIVPARLLLSGAGIVAGPPDVEPRAELRGDTGRLGKYVTETTYPHLKSMEKWLLCTYGRGGEIELAYRLPVQADRCVIRISRNQYNDTDIAISCNMVP
ncbi:hypothetical protein BZG29_25910 [Janthinobacterium sp. LM6]|uniref:STY0301 family protein n=1 Tax=Janthinobacterium sp. LM6 TaxID=1938606 RepID=UPI000983F37C|nr:STY0301 family protein [Janthinobacterium sp. LM6]AQR71372.1 hypothetical protein BZG29_25910 [Janthinobacterium sp. LM6]